MKKVFVVWYVMPEIDDDDFPPVEIGGIFSTQEKAQANCDRIMSVLPDKEVRAWFVEYEVE